MNSALHPVAFHTAHSADGMTTVESNREIRELLDAFEDADCRRILEATTDGALSVKEIAGVCELPLSTAYRKVDRMTEAGLLKESTRIHPAGKHASEYSRLVDDVVISVDDAEGVQFGISRRNPTRRPSQV